MATELREQMHDACLSAPIPIGNALVMELTPETATALLLLEGLTENELQIWLRFGKRMLDRHR